MHSSFFGYFCLAARDKVVQTDSLLTNSPARPPLSFDTRVRNWSSFRYFLNLPLRRLVDGLTVQLQCTVSGAQVGNREKLLMDKKYSEMQ